MVRDGHEAFLLYHLSRLNGVLFQAHFSVECLYSRRVMVLESIVISAKLRFENPKEMGFTSHVILMLKTRYLSATSRTLKQTFIASELILSAII